MIHWLDLCGKISPWRQRQFGDNCFVWNAEKNLRGAIIAVRDLIQQQHSCSLCAIAYNTLTEKTAWKACKIGLGLPVEEQHINQLSPAQFEAAKGEFPTVLAQAGKTIIQLLDRSEIDECNGDLQVFTAKMAQKLNQSPC